MVNKAIGPDPLELSLRSDRGSIDYLPDGRASLTESLLMSISSSNSSSSKGSLYNMRPQRAMTSPGGRHHSMNKSAEQASMGLVTVRDARLIRNEERAMQLMGDRSAATNSSVMMRPSTTPGGMHVWNASPRLSKSKASGTKNNEPVLADTLSAAFRAPPPQGGVMGRANSRGSPRASLGAASNERMTRAASVAAASHQRNLPQWESTAEREAKQAAAFGHSQAFLSDRLPDARSTWGNSPNQKPSTSRLSRSPSLNAHPSPSSPSGPHHDVPPLHMQYRKPVRMPPQNPEAGTLPPHLAQLMEGVTPLLPEKLDAAVSMAIHNVREVGECHMEGCVLSHLPQQLLRFVKVEGSYIKSLVLRNNRLEELSSLSMLPNLNTLVLSDNMFKHLPDSIACCRQLTLLDMSHNRLGGEAPFSQSALAPLTALSSLDIRSNRLQELPPYMDALRSLSVLRVDNNQIQTLPRALFAIPKLEILSASNNCITALPVELGSAPRLSMLALDNNCLSALPITLGGLVRCLKDLLLSNNELTILPRELAHLQGITQLTTLGNPLIFPPLGVCREGLASIRAFLQRNACAIDPEVIEEMRMGDSSLATASSDSNSQTTPRTGKALVKDAGQDAPPGAEAEMEAGATADVGDDDDDEDECPFTDEPPPDLFGDQAVQKTPSDDVSASASAQDQDSRACEQRPSDSSSPHQSPALKDASRCGGRSREAQPKKEKEPPPKGLSPYAVLPTDCPKCVAYAHQVEMIGHKILSVQLEKEKVERQLEVALKHLDTLVNENHLVNREIKELIHSKMARADDADGDDDEELDLENASAETLARQVNRLRITLRESRGELKGLKQKMMETEAQMMAERIRADAAAKVAGGSERNAEKAEDLAGQLEVKKADVERLHGLVAAHLEQYRAAEDRCFNAEARCDAMMGQMDGLQGEVAHLKSQLALRVKEVDLQTLEKTQMERSMQIEIERLQSQVEMLMKEREMFGIK